MKKRNKIILIVICSVIVVVGVVAFFQRNNIKALYYYLFYTEDKVSDLIVKNDEAFKETINKLPDITLRPLTDEERKKLNNDEITQEQAIDIILGKQNTGPESDSEDANDNLPHEGGNSGNNQGGSTSNPDNSSDNKMEKESALLDSLFAQILLLQAKFTNTLDNLVEQAKNEYNELPDDQKTASAKSKLGLKYLDLALALESECDKEINDLLSKIEAELKLTGGDTSIIKDIRDLYVSEKSLKKAEYLSKYGK